MTTFNVVAVSIFTPLDPLTWIYLPGSTSPLSAFFTEFPLLLEQFALYNMQLVIVGDLNIHLKNPSLLASSELRTIIDQFGLAQHAAEPTHHAGSWLYLILTLNNCTQTDFGVHPSNSFQPWPCNCHHSVLLQQVVPPCLCQSQTSATGIDLTRKFSFQYFLIV